MVKIELRWKGIASERERVDYPHPDHVGGRRMVKDQRPRYYDAGVRQLQFRTQTRTEQLNVNGAPTSVFIWSEWQPVDEVPLYVEEVEALNKLTPQ